MLKNHVRSRSQKDFEAEWYLPLQTSKISIKNDLEVEFYYDYDYDSSER